MHQKNTRPLTQPHRAAERLSETTVNTTRSDDDSPHGVLTPLSRLAGGVTILESSGRSILFPV